MSVERKFKVNLQALVKNYGASVRSLVERHGNRSLDSPDQKIPIGADTLIKSIQQLADMTIVQKAEPVAQSAALTSFQHGKAWAERALIPGVSPTRSLVSQNPFSCHRNAEPSTRSPPVT